jgi:hypothetical protein
VRAVNLMPRDERRARLELGRLPLLGAAGGIIAVTAGAFLLASSASSTTDDVTAEVQVVETTIERLPEAPGAALSGGAIVQERSDRVAALSVALATRGAYDRVLREISLVLPGDVWLSKLEVSAGAAATSAGGVPPVQAVPTSGGVTIEGATYSHESVATAIARLSVVPSLTGVRLTSTALVAPGSDDSPSGPKAGRQFVTFVVAASMRAEGTP